jgi:hypothetical protein
VGRIVQADATGAGATGAGETVNNRIVSVPAHLAMIAQHFLPILSEAFTVIVA